MSKYSSSLWLLEYFFLKFFYFFHSQMAWKLKSSTDLQYGYCCSGRKKTKKSKLQPNGLKITNFLKLNLKSTCSRQIFFGSSSLWLLEYFFLQIKLFTISIGKKLTFSVYMSHNSVKILQQPFFYFFHSQMAWKLKSSADLQYGYCCSGRKNWKIKIAAKWLEIYKI